ncbi:hypothetical protein ACWGF2_29765 [Streptomyces sp. NPDC054919]
MEYSYDPDQAERMSRRLSAAQESRNGYAEHYAERAEAREAEQREAEEFKSNSREDREWAKREELERRFWENEPVPNHADYEAIGEARKNLSKFIQRAEGRDLADRITRRKFI